MEDAPKTGRNQRIDVHRAKTFGTSTEHINPAGKQYRVKCCGDIIQSMSRHDMVTCKCGKNSIDGGSAYWRIVGDIDDFEEDTE